MGKIYKIENQGDTWKFSNPKGTEVYMIPISQIPPLMRDSFSISEWSPCGKIVYANVGIRVLRSGKKFFDSFQLVDPQGW